MERISRLSSRSPGLGLYIIRLNSDFGVKFVPENLELLQEEV
jgi:hypothetical protein